MLHDSHKRDAASIRIRIIDSGAESGERCAGERDAKASTYVLRVPVIEYRK